MGDNPGEDFSNRQLGGGGAQKLTPPRVAHVGAPGRAALAT